MKGFSAALPSPARQPRAGRWLPVQLKAGAAALLVDALEVLGVVLFLEGFFVINQSLEADFASGRGSQRAALLLNPSFYCSAVVPVTVE